MNEDRAQVTRLRREYERGRAEGCEELRGQVDAEIEQLRGVDRSSPQHLVIADRLEAILEGREAA